MSLVEGLEGKGHHIYTDNYYTGPALFRELRERGFGACGTVRVNRKGMPPEMKATLPKGEVCAVPLEDSLLALKWADKRQVSMLSSVHNDDMMMKVRRTRRVEGGLEEVRKPVMVEQYNQYMGGVDKSDQLLSYYGFCHRTVKWWRRGFFHLLDMAVVNAYVLYTLSEHTGRKLTHEQFRIELAKGLLMEVAINPSEDMLTTPGPQPRPLPPPARLTERHFPARLPDIPSGKKGQSNCTVCSGKRGRGRKTTTFMCGQCLLPMCVVPCFELYHTKVDPERYLYINEP